MSQTYDLELAELKIVRYWMLSWPTGSPHRRAEMAELKRLVNYWMRPWPLGSPRWLAGHDKILYHYAKNYVFTHKDLPYIKKSTYIMFRNKCFNIRLYMIPT